MGIDTLLPKKLTAKDDTDSYKSVIELNEVLSSAKELQIRNVALTGPFGSGKSSILITLRKDFPNGRNYLPISLATLQTNDEKTDNRKDDEESNNNGCNDKDDKQKKQCAHKVDVHEDSIENLNRKIEYSILQQLIYRE